MKKVLVSIGICILTAVVIYIHFNKLFTGTERESLLKKFAQEYAVAEKEFDSAFTTGELVSGAGGLRRISEKHLCEALDYKLRHTSDAAERLRIIEDFHTLSKEIQIVHLTPREKMGSLIGMWIYHAEANLMQQQISVWMLNSEEEKRWKRIADAPLLWNGEKIQLSRGKAKFEDVMYNQKVTLEIVIFPKQTLTYMDRDFAIRRSDIEFAGNDDFSRVCLCELKNGILEVRSSLKMPYFTKWEFKGNKLIIYGNNNAREEFTL